MAEQVTTPSTTLASLQEQLTCFVCLSQFDSPKTLPCLHSFCLKCIQQLEKNLEEGKYVISCPTCRKPAHVPDNGPADLPTAFFISSLVEIQDQLKKVSEKLICENCEASDAMRYCKQCAIGLCEKCLAMHNGLKVNSKHQIVDMKDVVNTASRLLAVKEDAIMNCTNHNEPLKIFCETCQVLICLSCTIRNHKDHIYDLIADTFPKHRQDIENALQMVAKKTLALQDALTAITIREEDVGKQRDDRVREIRLQVQGIVELVTQAGEQLVGEVNSVAKGKLQLLGRQKEEAELALVQLKSVKEFVEKGLEVGSPQQILSEKKNLIQGMEVVSEKINPGMFQPLEEANITFTENKEAKMSYGNIGKVDYSLAPGSITGTLLVKVPPTAGRKATVTLSLQTKLGSPLPSLPFTCHLIPAKSSEAIACDIEETGVGKYPVSFTPSAHGKHRVKIQVGGIDIGSSPFSLHVVPSPEMRGKPVKIISGFNGPCGAAIDKNEQLIVAENGNHCITVCDKEGKKVRSLGSEGKKDGQFIKPCGVAITDDEHILVTDNHRLQKLTPQGWCVMSVGSSEPGNRPLQFSYPRGIAVHPSTGQIYVADSGNHRIQVINNDFTYSHGFGVKGTAPGQLNYPRGVALDVAGSVYVASTNNNRIDKFTPDGKYDGQFGSKGSGDGQLSFPSSIAIDAHNIVYVAEERNYRISIFTTNGKFIRHIKENGHACLDTYYIYYISIDALGNLYFSNFYDNAVHVF